MKASVTWLALLGALLAGSVSMATAQTGSTDSLAGTSWQLVSYGPPGSPAPVLYGSTVTLTFQNDGQASGNGGCNHFRSPYAIEGETITFGPLMSTRMACADMNVMGQEQMYFDALQTAEWFGLAGNELTIQYGTGQLRFSPIGAIPNPQVESFENLDSPVGLLASYYNAINRQEYERAYGYWEAPPNTFEDFVSGFAAITAVQVIVEPPTRYEGAAGSTYVSIPTVLLAQTSEGTLLTFAGCVVTRKSNLMPPDIPEEDVWHLFRADFTEVPNDSAIPVLLRQACPQW